MNSAVASVLNKVLGDFIENLNPAQLNLSVFKGKINLRNLGLKAKVMDLLGLPFKLKFGIIGKIDVDIPWSSLGSTPLVVEIEDIVALVSPKPDKQWSQSEMQKIIIESRQEAIEKFEALNHPELAISEEPGYIASLIEKIVNNIQVYIKRIYIRYEDKLTSEFPFCIGVKLLEAAVFTCNKQWKYDYVNDPQTCFKVASLKDLSIFVDYDSGLISSKNRSKGTRGEVLCKLMVDDFAGKIPHKYVLHPFSLEVKLILYKLPGPEEPKVEIFLLKNDFITVDVQLEQVSIVIKVLNYLKVFDIFQAGVMKTLELVPMSDSVKPEYRLVYMKFRQEYLKSPESKGVEKYKKELKVFEEKLTTESIKNERNFIIKSMEIEKNIEKKQKQIEEVKKEGEGSVSKFFGFFAGKSDKEKQQELEEKQRKIEKLTSDIDSFHKGKKELEAQRDNIEMKKAEVTRIKIGVSLEGLKLSVLDGESLLSSKFENFILNIDSSSTLFLSISLKSIEIIPHEFTDNIFPFLLIVAPLEFEYTGTLLKYSCKGVEANVNLSLIMKIVNKILSKLNEATDLDKLINKTTSSVTHYIGSGKSYMASILKEGAQPSLLLDIHLKAPILYIPGLDNKEFLVVDLGSLLLMTEVKKGKNSQFENYQIKLENFKVFKAQKLSKSENWKNQHEILKPAKIHLDFRIYSRQKNSDKAMFKMFVDLFKADWNVTIPDVKFILQVVSLLSVTSEKPPESVPEVNDPVEVNSFSDDLKNFGAIQPWDFRIKMKSLKLTLSDEISEQFFLELDKVDLNFTISSKSRLQMFFSIEKLLVLNKKVANYKEIISRSNDSKYKHIRLILDYNPELSLTEISIALEDSVIFLNKSTIDHSLVLVDEILLLFPPAVPVKRYPKTFTKTYSKFLISIILMGVSIKVPLNPLLDNSNLTTVCFSSFVNYTSVTTMKNFYDKDNVACYSEYLELHDEAVANLTHFTIIQQSPSTSSNNSIFKPSRISVNYTGNSKGADSLKRVDINTESLCIIVGFYDIFAIKKIIELFTFASQPKAEGEKAKSTGKFVLNLDGDSLQVNLVNDTKKTQKQILHLQLSNISAFLQFENDSQDISFSTIIYCKCFNKYLGAWEPLLEDWKVEYNLQQESASTALLMNVKSDVGLDLNVNSSILSQISTIITSLNHEFSVLSFLASREKSLKKAGFQYKIINELTETVTVRLNFPQNKEKWQIKPNENYEFLQSTVDQLFINSNPFFKTTSSLQITQKASTLNVEIEGFEIVEGLSFEEIEIRSFTAKSHQSTVSCALITSSKGLMRNIRITNGLEISNNSVLDLEFSYIGRSFLINSGEAKQLPDFYKGELDCILIKNLIFETLITGNLLYIHNKPLVVELFEYQVQGSLKYLTIEINPVYIFHNMLPGTMKIYSSGNMVCEICVGDKVEPAEYKAQNCKFSLLFETAQGEFESEEFELAEDLKVVQLKGGKGQVAVELIDQDFRKNSLADLSQLERTKRSPGKYSSKIIVFYIENIILNKTNSDLVFSEQSLARNSWIFFTGSKGKVKIEKPETRFCKPFSLDTVSLSGSLQMPCKADNSIMNLGVNISMASSVISKTKIVKIVPRYIFSNTLNTDLFIKRFESEYVESIKQGQTLIYDPKKEDSAVQVSEDKQNWTGPFLIETLGDFQIRYLSKKGNFNSFNKKSWKTGKFQYIRVLVFTKDEATIFISFVEPQDPDYIIINHTQEPAILTQADCKSHEIRLKPGKSKPWAFDNLLIPAPKVSISMGESKGKYSLDKIKNCKPLGKYFVQVIVKDTARQMEIRKDEINEGQKDLALMKDPKIFKFTLNLSKLGISITDASNTDMIYVSLTDIKGKMKTIEENLQNMNRKVTKYDFILQEFQIDNMYTSDALFPVILNKLVYKNSEEEDLTPFVQLKIHTENVQYLDGNPGFDKIRWFEFSVRPITVKINEETIFSLIALKDYFTVFNAAPPKDVNIDLDGNPPSFPTEYTTVKSKAYFEFFRICAIKLEITFRKSSSNKEILSSSSVIFPLNVLKSVGTAFINISSAPISFTEILITHGFQTIENMSEVLLKNIIRQAIVQIFKILGSSDMIGNPVGLLDKLGSGVFEFVNEPAKGLLKGPKAFAQGLGKGVRSLVGAVVAGSFESVSKITGSLYNVLNEVGGNQAQLERNNSKIGNNVMHGLKDGVKDIGSGITGVFTKPFKGAKQEGAKGFFKGVGTGLFGLISTPFKVVLKISSTLTSSIAAGATLLSKGKIQTFGRCRFPRQTNNSHILEPYNNDLAQAKELMRVENQKKIINYSHISDTNDIILIITDSLIWIMNGDDISKLKIKDLTNMEINLCKEIYYLDIGGKNNKIRVPAENYGALVPLYYSITSISGPLEPFNKV